MSFIDRILARQLRTPDGAFGGLVLSALNIFNHRMMKTTASALALQLGESFLDVGFGGGKMFHLAARTIGNGWMAGVEPSSTALRKAEARFNNQIKAGRLTLTPGSADALPFDDARFDKVCSLNTFYFWPDPIAGLTEIKRVLKPGGRLVLGVYSAEALRSMSVTQHGYTIRTQAETGALIEDAGLRVEGIIHQGRRGQDFDCFVAVRAE